MLPRNLYYKTNPNIYRNRYVMQPVIYECKKKIEKKKDEEVEEKSQE